MFPLIQSSAVAALMIRLVLPHRPPALATMSTFPALRAVTMVPLTAWASVNGSRSTMDMSEALQVIAVGSMPSTTAGTLKVWLPSNDVYIGVKGIRRTLLSQVPGALLLPGVPLALCELDPQPASTAASSSPAPVEERSDLWVMGVPLFRVSGGPAPRSHRDMSPFLRHC